MTQEETSDAIKVMQAYVDGKEIEWHDEEDFRSDWLIDVYPSWEWGAIDYRIKQESAYPNFVRLWPDKLVEIHTEESKPFDWRGKNIQWVRLCQVDDIPLKVVHVDPEGITLFSISDHHRIFGWEQITLEKYMEWSEDNATWRKFE